MELNADFSQRVVMHSDELEWVDSPMKGVQRKMLDRIGDEVARATTIVRYAPDSHFSPHVHTGGEEFIVLEGVFQDEHGDFPVGSYVRNPPESSHTPGSTPGCVIFVKLWQFDLADRTPIRIEMDQIEMTPNDERPEATVYPLFQDSRETVRMELWEANSEISLDTRGGVEILVLKGDFSEKGDHFRKHSWLRLPHSYDFRAKSGHHGSKVWIKSGHLAFAAPPEL